MRFLLLFLLLILLLLLMVLLLLYLPLPAAPCDPPAICSNDDLIPLLLQLLLLIHLLHILLMALLQKTELIFSHHFIVSCLSYIVQSLPLGAHCTGQTTHTC